jgi:hypothetical protein
MDAAGATILATRVNISRFRRRDDEILLKGDLLDKIRNEKPDLKKDAAMVEAVKGGIEDFKKSWK